MYEKAARHEPVSGPANTFPPWFLLQIPALASLSNGPRPGSRSQINPFLFKLLLVGVLFHKRKKSRPEELEYSTAAESLL